ncbi:molybdopterin-guanine dinucleotide biosynthesis protein B [Desulfuromonas acetoxidans]|uniref:Molybdopterin-guanine dinucleotide biosynthesis protein B n=1 Tax=Desulfuromonas acetoxidans (strain DSM 684 / 11070) TaxID=281689 RepID=Q1JZJ6_DESA6|nr:molybdopterin-guanine dinucleotide biosynthesis protein B [Desulfuromonas acetoxidans]EAT15571.1 molybdopterin-guanine dinucleotide biosynthesis protein B [Desulfuromonas acetoxidans DSM 684]MBF0646087.1 molybdopterin-guanine dinucleotide biosynthesis protein B [Desulfuromonas acetoxidans]NVD25163.1 molybdopterin-guanine dinucleotide biosynthesis protein B [Desulfuromonas acetoxidans]NVE17215.1 molybdopterin-guanine dinucleotide biosynthesis protein B [Desulfuromonas acetoxidans]
MTIPAVSFIAKSGTGKTTLVEKIIAELKLRHFRVGAIKHDAHRFDIDHPGKDSHRFTAAGADTMLVCSSSKLALVKQHRQAPEISDLITTYFSDVDIVLTEGFKQSSMPKIEVFRHHYSTELICRGEKSDPSLIAVASDAPLEVDVPIFDLEEIRALTDFLITTFSLSRSAG